MFEQMISALKNGTFPDSDLLRKRFSAALVKKMGVIRTPYSFWPADPKINPPAKQLLWATILLHDKENFSIVEAIISTELEEKQRAKGHRNSTQNHTAKVQQLLQAYLREFIEFAPNKKFKDTLKQRTDKLFPNRFYFKTEL